jgi:hypothetical protein
MQQQILTLKFVNKTRKKQKKLFSVFNRNYKLNQS